MDKSQAARFYQKALSCANGLRGLVGSYEALGDMFESGDGVEGSAERMTDNYLSAAKLPSRIGQWKAANALEGGSG